MPGHQSKSTRKLVNLLLAGVISKNAQKSDILDYALETG